MTFRTRRALKKTRIEIIPMIDTMFFLLVFFMLSSLSLTNLLAMPVNLPQAANATKPDNLDFTISIDKDRRIYLNKQVVNVDRVGEALVSMAGTRAADLERATVVINADEGVPYGVVIHCIDQARGVGITHFPLATVPLSVPGNVQGRANGNGPRT